MTTLERLKESLRWPNVVKLDNGYYLISVPSDRLPHLTAIQGDRPGQTLYVIFDEFNTVPLCIRVESDAAIFEYYTLNKRLHRPDGPAFVRYEKHTQNYIKRWFWHGVLHRVDGPAFEHGRGLTYFEDEVDARLSTMMRTTLTLEWFVNGVAGNQQGGPIKAEFISLRETRMNDLLHGMNPENPAYLCDLVNLQWADPAEAVEQSGVWPIKMQITQLRYFYENGVRKERRYHSSESTWAINGESMVCQEFDDWIRDNLCNSINLIEGEFWGGPDNKLIGMSEFSRILSEAPP